MNFVHFILGFWACQNSSDYDTLYRSRACRMSEFIDVSPNHKSATATITCNERKAHENNNK